MIFQAQVLGIDSRVRQETTAGRGTTNLYFVFAFISLSAFPSRRRLISAIYTYDGTSVQAIQEAEGAERQDSNPPLRLLSMDPAFTGSLPI